jgi:hypothetical protein
MTKILDGGNDAGRLNLVLLSEGYRAQDMPSFRRYAEEFVRVVESEPWYRVGLLNVRTLEVESKEPGHWLVPHKGPRDTAFKVELGGQGRVERLITGDDAAVRKRGVLWAGPVTLGVLVNSRRHGGRGQDGLFWTCTGPGWTASAIHEFGHSFGGLRDEYSDDTGKARRWPADWPDPEQPNVTTDPTGRKWSHITDTVFEGAARHDSGIYRAFRDCRMRTLSAPFCAVCRDVLERKLEGYADELPEEPEPWVGNKLNLQAVDSGSGEYGNNFFDDNSAGCMEAVQWLLKRQFRGNG